MKEHNFNVLKPSLISRPNICVDRHTPEKDKPVVNETRSSQELEGFDDTIANHFQAALTFSSCVETPDVYECTTKSNIHGEELTHVVRYKCCHGFVRSRQQGVCVAQDDLKPLLEVLERLNASSFRNLVKIVGLEETLTKENFTVFAPLDEALEKISDEVSEMVRGIARFAMRC